MHVKPSTDPYQINVHCYRCCGGCGYNWLCCPVAPLPCPLLLGVGWVLGRSQDSEPSCISPIRIPYMSPHPIHALWKVAWLSEWGAFLLHPIRATLMSSAGEGWGGVSLFLLFCSVLCSPGGTKDLTCGPSAFPGSICGPGRVTSPFGATVLYLKTKLTADPGGASQPLLL